MKECDILGGVKTYSDPSYILSGVKPLQTPGSTPLASHTQCSQGGRPTTTLHFRDSDLNGV